MSSESTCLTIVCQIRRELTRLFFYEDFFQVLFLRDGFQMSSDLLSFFFV